jgi:hypothetical protein
MYPKLPTHSVSVGSNCFSGALLAGTIIILSPQILESRFAAINSWQNLLYEYERHESFVCLQGQINNPLEKQTNDNGDRNGRCGRGARGAAWHVC